MLPSFQRHGKYFLRKEFIHETLQYSNTKSEIRGPLSYARLVFKVCKRQPVLK